MAGHMDTFSVDSLVLYICSHGMLLFRALCSPPVSRPVRRSVFAPRLGLGYTPIQVISIRPPAGGA